MTGQLFWYSYFTLKRFLDNWNIMYLPRAASHLAFAHLKQNDNWFKPHICYWFITIQCVEYLLCSDYHLGCLCPWIVRLNIIGCRRSGYISGLLKFCVSASFWQFRDIKYFHFVFSRSLYIYVFSHVYIFLFMLYFLLCNSYLFWRTIPSSPIALCIDSFNYPSLKLA